MMVIPGMIPRYCTADWFICREMSGSGYGLDNPALAASVILGAMGDLGIGGLTWLSPLGWAQATRPFADERCWLLFYHYFYHVALVDDKYITFRMRTACSVCGCKLSTVDFACHCRNYINYGRLNGIPSL